MGNEVPELKTVVDRLKRLGANIQKPVTRDEAFRYAAVYYWQPRIRGLIGSTVEDKVTRVENLLREMPMKFMARWPNVEASLSKARKSYKDMVEWTSGLPGGMPCPETRLPCRRSTRARPGYSILLPVTISPQHGDRQALDKQILNIINANLDEGLRSSRPWRMPACVRIWLTRPSPGTMPSRCPCPTGP